VSSSHPHELGIFNKLSPKVQVNVPFIFLWPHSGGNVGIFIRGRLEDIFEILLHVLSRASTDIHHFIDQQPGPKK
jgi:hypothetical protein